MPPLVLSLLCHSVQQKQLKVDFRNKMMDEIKSYCMAMPSGVIIAIPATDLPCHYVPLCVRNINKSAHKND